MDISTSTAPRIFSSRSKEAPLDRRTVRKVAQKLPASSGAIRFHFAIFLNLKASQMELTALSMLVYAAVWVWEPMRYGRITIATIPMPKPHTR